MTSEKVPRHVAIIMDGNGRWAQSRGHARIFGHVRGSSKVKPIVREADRLGIKVLTLFAFSTENWTRPAPELEVLWSLLKKYLNREVAELDRNNVRLHVIGEIDRLRADVREVVCSSIEKLKNNTGLQLVFALSYGSQRELVYASQRFAQDCLDGKYRPSDMSENLMRQYLWTSDLGDLDSVDLVIRTSGEKRVSNFLLWQSAYAEYFFSDLCWPDFALEHFQQAVADYGQRERRFGGVGQGTASLKRTFNSTHGKNHQTQKLARI